MNRYVLLSDFQGNLSYLMSIMNVLRFSGLSLRSVTYIMPKSRFRLTCINLP